MSCEKREDGDRVSETQRRKQKLVPYFKASVFSEPLDFVLLEVERNNSSIRGAAVERPTLVRPGGMKGNEI
jgi:hypothetical protein